jgi:hypothetical protein
MKIIVHTRVNAAAIPQKLGTPHYSYYFVLAGFLPALHQLGTVVDVANPEEADAIYDDCLAAGEPCVFLSFAPPQLAPLTLRCPVIPVIAWEFSTMPCEMLDDDPRSDWRHVFAHCGRVITLSEHTADLVRGAMGADFPVFAIPTASFEPFAPLFRPGAPNLGARPVRFAGYVYDSDTDPLMRLPPRFPHDAAPSIIPPPPEPAPEPEPEPPPPVLLPPMLPTPPRRTLRQRFSLTMHYGLLWYREVVRDILPRPIAWAGSAAGRLAYRTWRLAMPLPPPPLSAQAPEPIPEPPPPPPPFPEVNLMLRDVVYTTVLSHRDGRKNWQDMVGGFLWTFRDNPRATLLLKMPEAAATEILPVLYGIMARFAPLRCRLLLCCGYLTDTDYAGLITASTYYLNTSYGEGLCLPLMEFLSAGKPAIAPFHTAMAEYLTPAIAFLLGSTREHNVWPHDPRDLFTTMRHRLNWWSLVQACEASFAAATNEDGSYEAMAAAASQTMHDFCSLPVVTAKLRTALEGPLAAPAMVLAEEPVAA